MRKTIIEIILTGAFSIMCMSIYSGLHESQMDYETWLRLKKESEFKKEIKIIRETIKLVETRGNYHANGASGEYGAYQFMPSTWKRACLFYEGRILDPTPENQDRIVDHLIKRYLDKGYTVKEIASIWNSGKPDWQGRIGVNKFGVAYNVPAYVDNFYNNYEQVKKFA